MYFLFHVQLFFDFLSLTNKRDLLGLVWCFYWCIAFWVVNKGPTSHPQSFHFYGFRELIGKQPCTDLFFPQKYMGEVCFQTWTCDLFVEGTWDRPLGFKWFRNFIQGLLYSLVMLSICTLAGCCLQKKKAFSKLCNLSSISISLYY